MYITNVYLGVLSLVWVNAQTSEAYIYRFMYNASPWVNSKSRCVVWFDCTARVREWILSMMYDSRVEWTYVQPDPEKMRPEMVIGVQNGKTNARSWGIFSKAKSNLKRDPWRSFRISISIPVTISGSTCLGKGWTNIRYFTHEHSLLSSWCGGLVLPSTETYTYEKRPLKG